MIFFAFKGLTTFLPVSSSNFKRASLAIAPPRLATFSCSGNVEGLTVSEISFVESSAAC